MGLAAAWLSLALVALVVSEALVVGLVDAVAAVAAVVQVATVSPPRQSGQGLSPMVLAPPRVSKVTFCPPRGLYPLALELSMARERCLAPDPALPSTGLPPGGPPVESHLALPAMEFDLDHSSVASHLVRPAWLSFCFSSPSWAAMAWGLS